MSLLLDALKKAAEQKSQKSKSESSPERSSDETLLETAVDDAALLADDETEFDHSELGVRLDRIGRERGTGDETGLDLPDATSTDLRQDVSTRGVGDETRLDVPDATGTNFQQDEPAHGLGDETGLDLPDATRTDLQKDVPAHGLGDETNLDLPNATRTDLQQEVSTHGLGDETNLDLPDATGTDLQPDVPAHGLADETGLDLPDATGTNLEHDTPAPGQPDETGLDIPNTTATEHSDPDDLSEHSFTGEDETVVFIAESASDIESESSPAVRARLTTEDETDLSQTVARGGLSEDHESPVDSTAGEGEADPGQPQQDSDAADDNIAASESDPTDLSQPVKDQAVSEPHKEGDETDFRMPSVRADQIEQAQAQQPPEAGLPEDTEDEQDLTPHSPVMPDEDLSLLLIEREDTKPGLAARTSFTEPQIPQAQDLALEDIAPGTEELSLADSTQTRFPREQTDPQAPTLTGTTATALHADETRTNLKLPTKKPVDSTSTRTYAPDNYDRTLMKVASDDASDIFSGMKSDTDIVMTPDYAKKVFRSKTSVQRARHYWVYAGIVGVLVLSIAIFGLFEYQDQSDQIDSSLRALKRDPLPGVIKAAQPEASELFTESDPKVDARTVEIIASANQTGSVAVVEDTVVQAEIEDSLVQTEIEDSLTQAGVVEAGPAPQPDTATAQTEPTTSAPRPEPVQAAVPRDDTDQVASLASSRSSPTQEDAQDNLHIVSSSQYRQVDIQLREAYAAYLKGDNRLALSLYNQVLEADPANRNALLARAAIYMQDGDINSAIKDYQALLLANPKDSLAMSSLLAVASYSPQDTESQLKLMIREEPDSPYLNFALANSYGAQKRWQEAQRHYFMALQNNPNDPNYAYNLAVSLEHISQPSSAITYYQRALDNFTNGLATFNRDVVNQRLEMLGKL